MIAETKIWGSVRHVFQDGLVAVSHLEILPNRFCSLHRHLHRFNQFTTVLGHIDVLFFGNNEMPQMMPVICHQLRKGQTLTMPPNAWHQFVSRAPSVVIETYWTEDSHPVSIMDIDRHTIGGIIHD